MVFMIIDFVSPEEGKKAVLNKKIDVADGMYRFIIFRLIQSQSQSGPASTKAIKNNPEGFSRMFFH